jgi:hypothetical protein
LSRLDASVRRAIDDLEGFRRPETQRGLEHKESREYTHSSSDSRYKQSQIRQVPLHVQFSR